MHLTAAALTLPCVVLQVQAFEASVAKDHKQFASTVTNSMTTTKKKLVEKFQVIEDLSAKYQQVGVP